MLKLQGLLDTKPFVIIIKKGIRFKRKGIIIKNLKEFFERNKI